MKRHLILIAALCLCAEAAQAQNYYPGSSGSVNAGGFTYFYRTTLGGNIQLYNSINRFTDVEWNAPQVNENLSLGIGRIIELDTWSRPNAYAIVNNAFSPAQKALVQGDRRLWTNLRIDPASGRIVDVFFEFYRTSPFVNIPPEVYASIENGLKRRLWYNITPDAKKFNYVIRNWDQAISLNDLTAPVAPPAPNQIENTYYVARYNTFVTGQDESSLKLEFDFTYPPVARAILSVIYYDFTDYEWTDKNKRELLFEIPPGTTHYEVNIPSMHTASDRIDIQTDGYYKFTEVDNGRIGYEYDGRR